MIEPIEQLSNLLNSVALGSLALRRADGRSWKAGRSSNVIDMRYLAPASILAYASGSASASSPKVIELLDTQALP